MPFEKLPGRISAIPQWNFVQPPSPYVFPTGEIASNAVDKLVKIIEQFSPESRLKRSLSMAKLGYEANLYKSLANGKIPQGYTWGANGLPRPFTQNETLAARKDARVIQKEGRLKSQFDFNSIGTDSSKAPVVPASQTGATQDMGERLLPPPTIIPTAIPDDAKEQPIFKKVKQQAIDSGLSESDAEKKAFEVLQAPTTTSLNGNLSATTTPEDYYDSKDDYYNT